MVTYVISTTVLTGKTDNSGTPSGTLPYNKDTTNLIIGRRAKMSGDSATGSPLNRAIIIDFSNEPTYQTVLNLVNNSQPISSIQMAFISSTSNSYTYNLTVGQKASTDMTTSTISSTNKVNLGTIAKNTVMNASNLYTITACGIPSHGLYCAGCGASSNAGYHVITEVQLTVNFDIPTSTLTTKVSPSGYGSVTSGSTEAQGTIKTLYATPGGETDDFSYSFVNWTKSGGGTLSSTTANPTNFTFNSTNATVTANFSRTRKQTQYVHYIQGSTSGNMLASREGVNVYQYRKGTRATGYLGTSSYYSTSDAAISAARTLGQNNLGSFSYTDYQSGGDNETRVGVKNDKGNIQFLKLTAIQDENGWYGIVNAKQENNQYVYAQKYTLSFPSGLTSSILTSASINMSLATSDSSRTYYIGCALNSTTTINPINTSWCGAYASFSGSSTTVNISTIIQYMLNNNLNTFYIFPARTYSSDENYYIIPNNTLIVSFTTNTSIKSLVNGLLYYYDGSTLKPAYPHYYDGSTLRPAARDT